MQAIKERGLRIPDDIARVGYNDLDLATRVEPPLTAVAAPIRELGATAMQMLQRPIVGEGVEAGAAPAWKSRCWASKV
jgi:DNA-binding LacI/PurR family transcriptional regulator